MACIYHAVAMMMIMIYHAVAMMMIMIYHAVATPDTANSICCHNPHTCP
jgi:hypothetical protein